MGYNIFWSRRDNYFIKMMVSIPMLIGLFAFIILMAATVKIITLLYHDHYPTRRDM